MSDELREAYALIRSISEAASDRIALKEERVNEQRTVEDMRAEVARQMIPRYHLAAIVGMHPTHLGQMLNGKRPMSEDLQRRIWAVLDEAK